MILQRVVLVLSAVIFGSLLAAVEKTTAEKPRPKNLVSNSNFSAANDSKSPADFQMSGDVAYGVLGDPLKEVSGWGIRLLPASDLDQDGQHAGVITTMVKNLGPEDGRWFRLRVRGLAQDDFAVEQDDLYLDVEFFRDGGTNSLDHIKQSIYPSVVRDRADLADKGTNKNLGRATWRSYDLGFRTPFPEVDTLKLSVGFGHGKTPTDKAQAQRSEFWINEIELTPIPVPADYAPPKAGIIYRGKESLAALVPLGGRWYYDPGTGDRTPPTEFNHTNAERLFYLSDRLDAPFAGNMSAWLRKGYLDAEGKLVKEDRYVPDNVVITFTKTHLVMRTKNLPNHPTAVFPDKGRNLDGDPNYIQEKLTTINIPLEPRENPKHIAMQNSTNNNHALPGGPIGVAVNGVVFFNPFDHLLDADAVWRLDRCCGHPSPRAVYHYHKYPVCVKSPWSDNGAEHSPLIGFAYDGYPVYGPYEAQGLLAKDDTANPLNEFNIHQDSERGWHYHVTPGKFPHIIGGYWGVAEERRGPPDAAKGPAKGKK